jgi:hypothetical protein
MERSPPSRTFVSTFLALCDKPRSRAMAAVAGSQDTLLALSQDLEVSNLLHFNTKQDNGKDDSHPGYEHQEGLRAFFKVVEVCWSGGPPLRRLSIGAAARPLGLKRLKRGRTCEKLHRIPFFLACPGFSRIALYPGCTSAGLLFVAAGSPSLKLRNS